MTHIFDEIALDILAWKPEDAGGDSEAKGVWTNKQPGNRCLWTCTWLTSAGQLTANQLLAVEIATVSQLEYELRDLLYSLHDDVAARSGRLLNEDRSDSWRERVQSFCIQRARLALQEFTSPWSEPEIVAGGYYAPKYRPGWGSGKLVEIPVPEVVVDKKVYGTGPTTQTRRWFKAKEYRKMQPISLVRCLNELSVETRKELISDSEYLRKTIKGVKV